MENLGLLAAFGAALAWGSYAVPFKKSRSERLVQFQAIMGAGILLSGFIISLSLGYSLKINPNGILTGMLWGSANVISLVSILNLGMSMAVPIIISLVIVSSFLWGVLLFGELPSGIIQGSLGILLITAGVITASATGSSKSKNVKMGLASAVAAGLIYGGQFVPVKLGNIAPTDFFFSMSLGIFITAVFIILIKRSGFKNEAVIEGFLSGVIWNIGNLLGVVAISLLGLAKGFPVTQLAVVVAVLWGIFYFREITKLRQIVQVLIGAMVFLAGVVILSLS